MSEPRTFSTSILIDAPTAEVYTYLADLPRHIEWNYQPSELIPLQDGPIQIGSQFSTAEDVPRDMPAIQKAMFAVFMPVMRFILGMEHNTIATVTDLTPNERIAWEARLPARKGDVMRMNWALELAEIDGQTQVTQHGTVAPPASSPFARMVNDQFVEDRKTEVAGNLRLLKEILERRD